MVTSNHVYADELTVHGEHDVKTWMQQDLKIEKPGAPPPVGKYMFTLEACVYCMFVCPSSNAHARKKKHYSVQAATPYALPCLSTLCIKQPMPSAARQQCLSWYSKRIFLIQSCFSSIKIEHHQCYLQTLLTLHPF